MVFLTSLSLEEMSSKLCVYSIFRFMHWSLLKLEKPTLFLAFSATKCLSKETKLMFAL